MPPVGVLVVDKPSGTTSRKAAAAVGRLAGAEKSGHAGTLDPLATGVLVVCLGRATLLTRFLAGGNKEYQVTALLGVETDTCDTDGRVISTCDACAVDREDVAGSVGRFTGEIEQLAPRFSAVKHNGKPLYKYARAGLEVERKPRRAFVESIEVTSFESGPGGVRAGLRVLCGPGTYVRSLVSDIGTSLGCGASVAELRRLRSGPFGIEGSIELERLFSGDAQVSDVMMTMEEATSWLPSVEVSSEGGLAVSQGKPLRREWLAEDPPQDTAGETYRVLDGLGSLLALYGPRRAEDDEDIHGRAIRVLRPSTLGMDKNEAA